MPSYLNQDHFWRDLLLFLLLCTCQRVCELFDFKWFGPGDLGSYHFLGPSALFVPPQTNPPPYSARKIFSTGINHQRTHQTLYILKQNHLGCLYTPDQTTGALVGQSDFCFFLFERLSYWPFRSADLHRLIWSCLFIFQPDRGNWICR